MRMSAPELIRIVSRDSPMALAQVERVRAELAALHPGVRTEVVPVRTTGDKWLGDLSQVEGKGAFTKEVDAALLSGEADLAVHCVKDVPADRPLPAGTVFAAFLKRDDVRDALVHPDGLTLDELPDGTRVGTSSVRRVAQLAATHPHLRCVPFRGNANRRLAKLAAGEADALLLAVSGLERIGRTDVISEGPVHRDDDAADRRGHPRPAVPRGRPCADRGGQRTRRPPHAPGGHGGADVPARPAGALQQPDRRARTGGPER